MLVQTELGPYEDEARNRIFIDGPHVELPSEAAVPIGMAIHELTTNAAKHGALSTFGGQVDVRWNVEQGEERPMLHFTWVERGGPRVSTPTRQGFGSRLLQRVLPTQLQADVSMEFLRGRASLLHDAADPEHTAALQPGPVETAMLLDAKRSHLVVVDVQAAAHAGDPRRRERLTATQGSCSPRPRGSAFP